MSFGRNTFNINIFSGLLLVIILVLFSVFIALFSNYFTEGQALKAEISKIENNVRQDGEFPQKAKDLLNNNQNLVFIKLLGNGGSLIESYGSNNSENVKTYRLDALTSGSYIELGIRDNSSKPNLYYLIIWCALSGLALSLLMLLGIRIFSRDSSSDLEKLISSNRRVARGDLSASIELSNDNKDTLLMIRLFESFNQMVGKLRRKDEFDDSDVPSFKPQIVMENDHEGFEIEENKNNNRNVTVLVAKIADFNKSVEIDPSKLASFLKDFRKQASDIVSNYGGVIEALLKDEIIALFNVPDEINNPELRAVSASVEIIQLLASTANDNNKVGNVRINGKIGIGLKPIQFYMEAGVPQGVKEVVKYTTSICDVSPNWKILLSPEVYELVNSFVGVKDIVIGEDKYYSVVTVEEGVF